LADFILSILIFLPLNVHHLHILESKLTLWGAGDKSIIWLFIFLMTVGLCCIGTAAEETESIPRPEYPRPQFFRSSWVNLNGDWTYIFDFGKSGKQRDLADSKGFEKKITVPFCPESPLSGVNYKDFIDAMWYQREVFVPGDWTDCKILLHFGAVDYRTEVFIDGEAVGKHWGGTSSFTPSLVH